MATPAAREQARLLGNWRAERDSATLYAALAQLENDAQRRGVYLDLAEAERRHAEFWEQRLRVSGRTVPVYRPTTRIRILKLLARHLGIAFVVPSVIVREMKERDDYVGQEDAFGAGLPAEEHGHAAALRGSGHKTFGNNLRAAVLGANDGLASNFCLMMGVAGARVSTSIVLLTGIAGLLGGACSMALGEWLSVTNARELALSQLDRAIGTVQADPEHASIASAGDAVGAASVSFLLFALGALVPLLPFCVLPAALRIGGSIALSAAALFMLGVATSLFNARSALYSGVRQTAFGAAAALLTYFAGRAFNALASGG
ncbi:MAG TPA: VIT1/CCC1 family protein [Steroidobacteraceae bacterium]|jgi:VIT1/CCC1 family predicted Fe2+/Mn2+ transporter|nr:VIT1/CCC1 family protein [Steroidobacteraceae bacterium]